MMINEIFHRLTLIWRQIHFQMFKLVSFNPTRNSWELLNKKEIGVSDRLPVDSNPLPREIPWSQKKRKRRNRLTLCPFFIRLQSDLLVHSMLYQQSIHHQPICPFRKKRMKYVNQWFGSCNKTRRRLSWHSQSWVLSVVRKGYHGD